MRADDLEDTGSSPVTATMKKLSDPEFEIWFKKFLLDLVKDPHIFDYEIEKIAWALQNGDFFYLAYEGLHSFTVVNLGSDPNNRIFAETLEKAMLWYIVNYIDKHQVKLEVQGDDLLFVDRYRIVGRIADFYEIPKTGT